MGLHPSPLPEIGTFLTVSVSALSLHSFYNPTTFCLFSFFSQCKDKYSTNLTINEKSINGVLGTQIWGSRMYGQTNPLSYGSIP